MGGGIQPPGADYNPTLPPALRTIPIMKTATPVKAEPRDENRAFPAGIGRR